MTAVFFRLQRIKFGAQVFFYLVFQLIDQITFEIALQHQGMDVALAADGRRVAQPRGDALDRLRDDCAWPRPRSRRSRTRCRASAASTVPAQVRKSLAVKSSPLISRR